MRQIASKLSKAEKFRLATTMKPYSTRNAKQVKKKERAPTYLEEANTSLKKLQLATGETQKLTKGPVIDSAATVAVMTTSDSKKCDTITALTTPITMDTIDGETRANKVATVELPIMHVTGAVVLDKAQVSVVPTHEPPCSLRKRCV